MTTRIPQVDAESQSEPPSSGLDVLTVGHALVDVLAEAEDEFLLAEGLTKGAMLLTEDAKARVLYERIAPAIETSGGSAANTAAGVVACGGSAAFIGTVADDELGEIFTHDLRAAGVLYGTPPVKGSSQTGRSMIIITPDGQRTMNTNIGVSGVVSTADLDRELLEMAKITYVEGFLFDDQHSLDGWTTAIKTVKRAGNRFSITLSDSFCVERHRSLFLGLLNGSVDICFGNEDELCALFEVKELDTALDKISERCEIAAITRGPAGSVLVGEGRRVEVTAEPTTVVDTTGAGDLYAAGVLTGLANGRQLEDCGRMGSHAAAAVVARMGARLIAALEWPDLGRSIG